MKQALTLKKYLLLFIFLLTVSCLKEPESSKITCPKNFIPVPKMKGYTDKDFCIGKYETKLNKRANPATYVVQPGLFPKARITRNEAIEACQSMGKGYDLISNHHWQTVARNIESVAKNWRNEKVGDFGGINRGHTDNSPGSQLFASKDDNKSCYLTGQECDLETWHVQRRTHFLSNGEVIWDFSGNLWEWVKDNNTSDYGYNSYVALITEENHKKRGSLNDNVSRTAKEQFGPSGTYNKVLNKEHYGNFGHAWIDIKKNGIRRGGRWAHGASGGIFAVNLSFDGNEKSLSLGFRCIFEPN